MSTTKSLTNKTAIVTGSARGAGLGIAIALAKEGCNIVIADRTETAFTLPGTIYTAAKEIEENGGNALPVRVDVRSEEQIVELKNKTIEAFKIVCEAKESMKVILELEKD